MTMAKEQPAPKNWFSLFAWVVIVLLALSTVHNFIKGYRSGLETRQRQTVGYYQQQLISGINQMLERPENPIRKRIEDAHVTVTAKSAKVSACTVYTVDGSNYTGEHDSNISEIDLVITVIWDGWLQQKGYTEFEIVYDAQNKIVKETKYLRSSAKVNMETVNWFAVGYTIGEYIGEASL
jgi:hypothetical protein